MVDEYQDTNLVQGRLVKLLAGENGNVMAVGDDAQSIYAFRGATVSNILDFPKNYKDTKIVRLEQNYRSTQPILDLTNHILDNARDKFDKRLFTENAHGKQPRLIHAFSDQSQAERVVGLVAELRREYLLHEIAVLFRAGYQSYPLEMALERARVPYQKFGGVKFHEAAHIKDAPLLSAVGRQPRRPDQLAAGHGPHPGCGSQDLRQNRRGHADRRRRQGGRPPKEKARAERAVQLSDLVAGTWSKAPGDAGRCYGIL